MFQDYYSRYFKIIDTLLQKAHSQGELPLKEIQSIIERLGFQETSLMLFPQLKNVHDSKSYPLFKTEDGKVFKSRLNHTPTRPLSAIERQWLKTVIADPKASLFMEETLIEKLQQLTQEDPNLYNPTDFIWHGTVSNADPWEDQSYRNTFKKLLQAIQENKVVLIHYNGAKGTQLSTYFIPRKLEYSPKYSKFRVLAFRMRKSGGHRMQRLNLARIESVELTDQTLENAHMNHAISKLPTEILELEISNFRNGIERAFYQFSIYERSSTYDEETNTCRMKISYLPANESELMIQVLSFGPIIKVIAPEHFKQALMARLEKQSIKRL